MKYTTLYNQYNTYKLFYQKPSLVHLTMLLLTKGVQIRGKFVTAICMLIFDKTRPRKLGYIITWRSKLLYIRLM